MARIGKRGEFSMGNALVVHGGAPTAVINSSLYGVVEEAKRQKGIGKLYAAIGGSGGILKEEFLDLKTIGEEKLKLLLETPASAIGTSRDALKEDDYKKIVDVIKKYEIRYVFFNGGNGSMDACARIYRTCRENQTDITIIGIPKTMDNDIVITDHAPGFGSAARYMAAVTNEISQDIQALPIHVCIVEAMGRNAGWVTAASALAREAGGGPDLIYLPEIPFDEDAFLRDVKWLYEKKGGVLVVVSEGLRNHEGVSIVPPVMKIGRSVYYGDVGAYLAQMVIQKLGIKARNEKPGLCIRVSMEYQSDVDRKEAVLAGKEAVRAAVSGENGVMVGFRRIPGDEYQIQTVMIPLEEVMMKERSMPRNYINSVGNDVTDDFLEWCRPLIGRPLRRFVSFRGERLLSKE